MSNATAIQIDIVSDVVCPWCVIGYKRLEQAISNTANQDAVSINWHPFELNPSMPEEGQNLREHLAGKYGTTREQSIKARENLTKLGEELSFSFDYSDDMRMYNTFKAHQLLHWAREFDKETQLQLRLFSAFFTERKQINDIDVLASEAATVGLDAQAARSILQNGTYENTVRDEQQQWMSRGIQAVPTFIFNGQRVLTGAQPVEIFEQALLALS